MREEPHKSIADNAEAMEAPAPHQIGHRKKFDAFEQNITGGHHIGHLPVYVVKIEGWMFRCCRCGFSLALTPSGSIWWLRTTKDAMAINSFKALLRALNSNYWAHPRPRPLKNAVISPPTVVEIAAETGERAAVESAVSSAPPPAKRRRTYVPDDTTRPTRPRPNPASR